MYLMEVKYGFFADSQQQELIGLAKEISEKEIAPRALDIDKSGVMDEDLLNILKQSGMTTWLCQLSMADQDLIFLRLLW